MRRLLAIFDRKVQIECYPEAHWSHAYKILRNRTPTTDRVMKLILSFGINDRAYSLAEMVGKLVKKTLSIPTINFNRYLPKKQCTMLNHINYHITSMCKMVDIFQYEKFRTKLDLTHWTHLTGKAVWDHWVGNLNCWWRATL